MFFIQTDFKEPNKLLYVDLLKQIDKRILQIAKNLHNNIRFGFLTKINKRAYKDLLIYKSIINDIMYCSDSMCDVNGDILVGKIKKILNSIC